MNLKVLKICVLMSLYKTVKPPTSRLIGATIFICLYELIKVWIIKKVNKKGLGKYLNNLFSKNNVYLTFKKYKDYSTLCYRATFRPNRAITWTFFSIFNVLPPFHAFVYMFPVSYRQSRKNKFGHFPHFSTKR